MFTAHGATGSAGNLSELGSNLRSFTASLQGIVVPWSLSHPAMRHAGFLHQRLPSKSPGWCLKHHGVGSPARRQNNFFLLLKFPQVVCYNNKCSLVIFLTESQLDVWGGIGWWMKYSLSGSFEYEMVLLTWFLIEDFICVYKCVLINAISPLPSSSSLFPSSLRSLFLSFPTQSTYWC